MPRFGCDEMVHRETGRFLIFTYPRRGQPEDVLQGRVVTALDDDTLGAVHFGRGCSGCNFGPQIRVVCGEHLRLDDVAGLEVRSAI